MLLSLRRSIRTASSRGGLRRQGTTLPRRTLRRLQGPATGHGPTTCAARSSRCRLHRAWACRCWPFEGVEADDVIGTLAATAPAPSAGVVISPATRTWPAGLPYVTLVKHHERQRAGRGRGQDQVRRGSGADHRLPGADGRQDRQHPGVPGVGEKTAAGLLNGIGGGLDNLTQTSTRWPPCPCAAPSRWPPSWTSIASRPIVYQLATIKLDVPLDLTFEESRSASPCGSPDGALPGAGIQVLAG